MIRRTLYMGLIASHDRDTAWKVFGGDEAGRRCRGHVRLIRLEPGQARHVRGRAVAEVSHDDHLLATIAVQKAHAGQHLDPAHGWRVCAVVGSALTNPALNQGEPGEPLARRLPPP